MTEGAFSLSEVDKTLVERKKGEELKQAGLKQIDGGPFYLTPNLGFIVEVEPGGNLRIYESMFSEKKAIPGNSFYLSKGYSVIIPEPQKKRNNRSSYINAPVYNKNCQTPFLDGDSRLNNGYLQWNFCPVTKTDNPTLSRMMIPTEKGEFPILLLSPKKRGLPSNLFRAIDFFDRDAICGGPNLKILELRSRKGRPDILVVQTDFVEAGLGARSKFVITKYRKELTLEQLRVPVPATRTEESGFVVGGINSSEKILELSTINGIPIEEIEKWSKSTFNKFLNEKQKLTEVMAADNNWVLEHGLTHQKLAEPLFLIKHLAYYLGINWLVYNGKTFSFEWSGCKGIQDSPFRDPVSFDTDLNITVRDPDGKIFQFAGLHPIIIHNWGFYEGPGIAHRVDPKELCSFFGIK